MHITISEATLNRALDIAVGYGVSVVLGAIIIKKYVRKISKERDNHPFVKDEKGSEVPTKGFKSSTLGAIERFLYTTALLLNKGEFIAVWIVMKFGGHYTAYNSFEKKGWGRINIFLIGVGLSLIFAVLGYVLIEHRIFSRTIQVSAQAFFSNFCVER